RQDRAGAGGGAGRRDEESRDRAPGNQARRHRNHCPHLRRATMGQTTESFRLPVLGELDIEAELAKFEVEESAKLGLKLNNEHWVDQMVNPQFTKSQRPNTTLLVSGLTQAHDYLVKAALSGIGYKVEVIDVPDNDALRYGK